MPVAPTTVTADHVDRLLAKLQAVEADIDLEVEGIVDRISSINKRVKHALRETLAEHGLTPEHWGVMTTLYLGRDYCSTPGDLAADLELSSGAMTSRIDRLEQLGLVRRLPDPNDRRGVRVELTEAGREAWERAISVQGRKEAFFASALSKKEQQQLNMLLRKLMVAFDERG